MAKQRRRPRLANALDMADEKYGLNPHDLAQATRRSLERTGDLMPRGDGRFAPDRSALAERRAIVRRQRDEVAAANGRRRR